MNREKSFEEKKKKSLSLLKEAGFVLKKGLLVHKKTQKPFRFNILIDDPAHQRIAYFFAKDLKRIGIEAKICKVHAHSLLKAQNQLQFDMLVGLMSFSPIPGTELIEIYGSGSAHRERTFNLAGIQNKNIDFLIQKILSAKTFDQMKLYTNVLDRVLNFYHYGIPFWFSKKIYYAFWDSFGMPDHTPLSGPDVMLWWQR